jgi:hypothetical protein
MVNKYFVTVETGMERKNVVDGPVFDSNGSDKIVGRISAYNPDNGSMLIELIEDVDYKGLLKIGIPLDNIIFNNFA